MTTLLRFLLWYALCAGLYAAYIERPVYALVALWIAVAATIFLSTKIVCGETEVDRLWFVSLCWPIAAVWYLWTGAKKFFQG